jgi:leader peptidase (prepilin peptidase)/N-methyltransferase
MGSFAAATVWRIRARQLFSDKEYGEKVNQKEYDRLKKLNKSLLHDRSICLSCGYELKWYDLIPLISWISLGGRCRKCKKTIGYFEPLMEISVAAFFVLSYAFWPYLINNNLDVLRLILWLVAGVPLAILFAYDLKWSLLDPTVNKILIVIGFISSVSVIISSTNPLGSIYSILGAVLILSGLYFVFYIVSRGRWVGDGDPVLALGLALLLADWKLAFIALFAANLIGSLAVMPGLIMKKLKGDSHVPFGPLLIAGFVVAGLFGNLIVNWYQHLIF